MGDRKQLESLQRRWTHEVDGLGNMDYVIRLEPLRLYSIAGRLLRNDIVKDGVEVLPPGG